MGQRGVASLGKDGAISGATRLALAHVRGSDSQGIYGTVH
jgi:hypothetical protein